jgi:hypothetical protein
VLTSSSRQLYAEQTRAGFIFVSASIVNIVILRPSFLASKRPGLASLYSYGRVWGDGGAEQSRLTSSRSDGSML